MKVYFVFCVVVLAASARVLFVGPTSEWSSIEVGQGPCAMLPYGQKEGCKCVPDPSPAANCKHCFSVPGDVGYASDQSYPLNVCVEGKPSSVCESRATLSSECGNQWKFVDEWCLIVHSYYGPCVDLNTCDISL